MRRVVEESQLRYRWERPISVASVLVNLSIMIAAIAIVTYGSEWLAFHPFLAKRMEELRMAAIAAVLAPPAIAIMRNARRGSIRGNSIRLSSDQIPEIYRILEKQCERLGITETPELYLSNTADESHAFSSWKRNFIVLSTDNLGAFEESHDVIAFFLGRQIGAIRLGHVTWWNELLLWYILKLPWISLPVRKARAYSEDCYGAFLSPHGLRALLLLAAGRHLTRTVNIQSYLQQVSEYGGLWDRAAAFGAETSPIARRVKALHEAGLLRWDDEAGFE